MATINIMPLIDALGGSKSTGATGNAVAVVMAGGVPATRIDGAEVIFPEPIEVAFTNGVLENPMELYTLPTGYYWKLVFTAGEISQTFYFVIPAEGTYDFSELTFIDPLTTDPLPLVVSEVDYVQWDTDGTAVADVAGKAVWNTTEHTIDIALGEGDVVLQVGQEFVQYVENKTGADIANGKVVRIVGSTGQKLDVAPASNTDEVSSSTTFGVVTHAGGIANNQSGFVTIMGKVRGINTNSWEEGDQLWLGTNGNMTNVKPEEPGHLVAIGWVVVKSGNGTIFVKIQNGYELDELHGVKITNPQDGQVLTYNASLGLWVNA